MVLPDDAGIGVTPQRWANDRSDLIRSGSPAVTRRVAAPSGPTP